MPLWIFLDNRNARSLRDFSLSRSDCVCAVLRCTRELAGEALATFDYTERYFVIKLALYLWNKSAQKASRRGYDCLASLGRPAAGRLLGFLKSDKNNRNRNSFICKLAEAFFMEAPVDDTAAAKALIRKLQEALTFQVRVETVLSQVGASTSTAVLGAPPSEAVQVQRIFEKVCASEDIAIEDKPAVCIECFKQFGFEGDAHLEWVRANQDADFEGVPAAVSVPLKTRQ